jgi:hypothetical protein
VDAKGRTSFLKKRSKKLLQIRLRPLRISSAQDSKVFWFFFSKKNCLNFGGWPALGVLMLCSLLLCAGRGGRVAAAHGDVPEYLATAYHMVHDHLYSGRKLSRPPEASLGREPAYPLLLAGLLLADPGFAQFGPTCVTADDACPARTYRTASLANLALIELAGLAMFLLGRLVGGTPAGGLVASAYLLLNMTANKGWADLMSDRLAVALLTLAMLALACAWRGRRMSQWALTGAAFAALTLTKALFFPFCVLAWVAASAIGRRRALAGAAAVALSYAVIVGGWAARNAAVSGEWRLTDSRSGIALSTREVFDGMTPAQYAASFVYWTRGFGPGLARHLFAPDTVAPFDLDRPGGFYDRGQNGYARQVNALRQAGDGDYWAAVNLVDAGVVQAICRHWVAYLITMPPLIYRGLWEDEFIVLGLPCLVVAVWRAWRGRDWLVLLLLSTGVFNLLAYAAVSLNIPRYQLTALPAIALGVGWVLTHHSARQHAIAVPV